MSFKQITWGSILLGSLCFLLLTLHLLDVKPKDIRYYRKLMDVSSNKKAPQNIDQSSSKQYSEKLSKEIWVSTKHQRQQILLVSEGADLDFIKHKDKIEVVENMTKVKIWVQEELFYVDDNGEKIKDEQAVSQHPMQQILILESNNASYYWKTRLIVAKKADITRFISPSHSLRESLLKKEDLIMKGKAKLATLSFKDKKIAFNARHLKAKFMNKGSL
jgi:hypothetical protein